MPLKNWIAVLLLYMIMTAVGYAQTEQHSIRIGGDFSFDYHDVTIEVPFIDDIERSTSTITLQLRPGYFVVDQMIAGADVGYTNFKNAGESFGQELFVGPMLGYYIKSGSKKLFFPIVLSAGYLSQKTEEEFNGNVQEFDFTGMYYGATVGMEYISGKNLGLSLTFGPQIRDLEDNVAGITIDQYLTSWQIRIGASYYFVKDANN